MLQRIGSIGLVLHLGLVFLHNICNIQLPSTKLKSALDPITHAMQKLCSTPGFRHYGQLAGIHGCYGFYSPQVGSVYSSRIEVHCARTASVLRLSYPGLRSTASKIRYCTLLEALEGWRAEGDQPQAPALARATAKSLYNHVQRQYPDREIRLRIYSIRIPSLNELRSKKQTNKMIIPIYEHPTQQPPPYTAARTFGDGLQLLPRGIGLLLWIEMLQLWPDLSLLYGPHSVYDTELLPYWHSGSGWNWEELFRRAHPLWIHLTATLYSVCCICLVFDRWIPYSSLLLLIIHHGLFMADLRWAYGADYLAQTGLLFSLLFSYHPRTDSRHKWLRKGVYFWQAQLVLVYFFGGLGKAMGPTWWNGEAIWKAVQQPFPGNLLDIPLYWGSWPMCWTIIGIAVVLLELGYVLAWNGKTFRNLIYLATIAMHAGIALTIGLYHFSALMIWYNLCAWYYPYRTQTSYPIHNAPLGHVAPDAASTVKKASIQYKERR